LAQFTYDIAKQVEVTNALWRFISLLKRKVPEQILADPEFDVALGQINEALTLEQYALSFKSAE
jgi:hypothetical protein